MTPRLILVTGPAGIGKTAVARHLFERLDDCAWLDGDDVWRFRPFEVSNRTKQVVERNIPFVLDSYLAAGHRHVILSWVLHRRSLIDRILGQIAHPYEPATFTLVAKESALRSRFEADPSRGEMGDRMLLRLRQARELDTIQIDTTDRGPEEVADEIARRIAEEPAADHTPVESVDHADPVERYYAQFDEWGRLTTAEGHVEYERTLSILDRHLPVAGRSGRVLDLGGGPGRYTIALAQRGYTVSLADLSEEQLAVARERIAAQHLGERVESVRRVNAVDLSAYPDRTFDAVLAFGPFYHLVEAGDRARAAAEIARVLRPGGLVAVAFIPRLAGLASMVQRASWDTAQVDPARLDAVRERGVFHNAAPRGFQQGYFPEPDELRELFASAGIEEIETTSIRGLLAERESAWLSIEGEKLRAGLRAAVDATASDPAVVRLCGHAMFVGRGRG